MQPGFASGDFYLRPYNRGHFAVSPKFGPMGVCGVLSPSVPKIWGSLGAISRAAGLWEGCAPVGRGFGVLPAPGWRFGVLPNTPLAPINPRTD